MSHFPSQLSSSGRSKFWVSYSWSKDCTFCMIFFSLNGMRSIKILPRNICREFCYRLRGGVEGWLPCLVSCPLWTREPHGCCGRDRHHRSLLLLTCWRRRSSVFSFYAFFFFFFSLFSLLVFALTPPFFREMIGCNNWLLNPSKGTAQ